MLTDVALKNLRARAKGYKVTDRDGMYVHVSPGGAISFRFDYRLNGRRETVMLGRYGPAGLSLARAREKCLDARRAVSEGRSPAIEKQREKRRIKEAKSFGQFGEKWLTTAIYERATGQGLPLEPFTVHDLRRTGSTLLNELGYNSDWIEKCLAHEDGRSSRGVYNKAEYEVQRRHMLQEWSNVLEAWAEGRKYVPVLMPPQMPILAPDPSL